MFTCPKVRGMDMSEDLYNEISLLRDQLNALNQSHQEAMGRIAALSAIMARKLPLAPAELMDVRQLNSVALPSPVSVLSLAGYDQAVSFVARHGWRG
jgi:hypothetical protein